MQGLGWGLFKYEKLLGSQGASRPSSISTFNCSFFFNHFLFLLLYNNKNKKKFPDFSIFVSWISKFYENLNFWRHIFAVLSIHETMGWCELPQKMLGPIVSVVLTFIGYKQAPRQAKYMYRYWYMSFRLYIAILASLNRRHNFSSPCIKGIFRKKILKLCLISSLQIRIFYALKGLTEKNARLFQLFYSMIQSWISYLLTFWFNCYFKKIFIFQILSFHPWPWSWPKCGSLTK